LEEVLHLPHLFTRYFNHGEHRHENRKIKINKITFMEEKLIKFIIGEFVTDPDTQISEDTKLISSGLIDSFSLVSLQAFIEREFGKRIPAPRINAESFDTVRQMVAIINQF
jgi:acyl carrier protein